MRYNPPTQERGLRIARRLKQRLIEEGVPIVQVFLFGSLAEGKRQRWSDVDIAVVYDQFGKDRLTEHSRIADAREDFDVPMDIVSLRREDLDNRYSTIVQEVKRHGIVV
jgi:predicted nucleotidyltransferase